LLLPWLRLPVTRLLDIMMWLTPRWMDTVNVCNIAHLQGAARKIDRASPDHEQRP
jgi:hypothetical protein